jgi:hypothetical protein
MASSFFNFHPLRARSAAPPTTMMAQAVGRIHPVNTGL